MFARWFGARNWLMTAPSEPRLRIIRPVSSLFETGIRTHEAVIVKVILNKALCRGGVFDPPAASRLATLIVSNMKQGKTRRETLDTIIQACKTGRAPDPQHAREGDSDHPHTAFLSLVGGASGAVGMASVEKAIDAAYNLRKQARGLERFRREGIAGVIFSCGTGTVGFSPALSLEGRSCTIEKAYSLLEQHIDITSLAHLSFRPMETEP